MNIRILIIAAIGLFNGALHAQTVLKGTVYEGKASHKLSNVFIRDINSKEIALTDNSGNFSIRTAINHTLIFSSPGYISDTLYLVDLKPKRVELSFQGISLNQVNITSTRTFNPREEYPDVYEKSKFALSPSRIFGKEAKDARRLKRYFDREADERKIDSIFNPVYVSSVVPLKGRELEDFMTMYRPSLSFLQKTPHSSLTLYINDSYKKFMALPPEKRSIQRLSAN
ncbi:peptidase associated/transthyretin-like domain-containing protein [Mucilaginibacter arboris]|uniref:Carboxypeptidase-like regulatory domain-containing protein n=1 Tax=Mucilaginibacter arboris TaxID=2682090 RepID=A0A7K1T194_9SPHI|nr:hypothetical protein [Mucilaginibacter arboris]MVN23336.1 hypothetical protein [Mucilaginibacter arboris]